MPLDCLDWTRRLFRRVVCRVDPARFDYVRLYASADLDRDHWSIVGPGSRAEFEELGRGKLRALIEQGMTPTSRVLDIGCGTGQLTGPMADYLAPQGFYLGTDIAPQAIDYCKKRFVRPNFRFLVNDMTRLPIDGRFDVIFLGSVLTHLYPGEVGPLLGEVARLLEERGFALADAFVTDEPAGHCGHRGMVRMSEPVLHRQFGESKLSPRVLFTTPQRRRRRVMYRLCHAEAGFSVPSSDAGAPVQRCITRIVSARAK
jgi:SAM-dependent methyltransferase